ncbi:MAG: 23S rRNA (guanosine(2251)-2'-O)-methyltransferase RlmB [Alphaproteobacteria bacterium]
MTLRKRRSAGNDKRRFWLYGHHAVAAALANPERRCRRLLATQAALAGLRRRAAGRLDGADLGVEVTARGELGRVLPHGAVHQGVALEVEPLPAQALATACTPPPDAAAAVVVLDQVTDPQNVGAVLRAAAAFGALAVVVPERHAPHESGALAKAASGALEAVALVRVANLARALDDLKRLGYWCLGLDPAADDTLATANPGGPVALVLGAEGAGLRRLTRERCDLSVRLPISDAVESLNVAAAAAVALYTVTQGR